MSGRKRTAKKQVEASEPVSKPLRLEWRSPAELAENPRNWRRHPEAQVAALSDVLAEVGWAGACLYNEATGRLIDGHARRKVALDQGAESVPVLVGSWSEADEAKILATLDPIAGMAQADAAALDALLRDVQTGSQALGDMLTSLAEDAGVVPPDVAPGGGGDEFDPTPEQTGPTRTKPGELWVIGGKHRLLVGDCTAPENVARLMSGRRAALCLTDPPYGVGWDYESTDDTVANLRQLIDGFLPLARELADVVLLTSGNARQRLYPPWDWCLCWFVPAGTGCNPWGFTCWQPVLAYGKCPYLSRGMGLRPDGLNMTEAAPELGHPCPKPLKVWQWMLERGSAEQDDLIYDPFLGSGTTLIAAHRLGRVCYGCEIEPRYADVILKRAEAEGLICERADG